MHHPLVVLRRTLRFVVSLFTPPLRVMWPVLLLALAPAVQAQAGVQGFYRFPALRGDNVFFVAEGDLWRASTQGGRAERLTTHPGAELRPAVAPDGRWLAFNASYEGPLEAYTMATEGGPPRRISWDGRGALVWGVTAAGDVLVSTASESGRPGTQLAVINPTTLARRVLPVVQATDGALSPDGRTLFFTREGLRGDNVLAYRGGAMARLWRLDLTGSAEAQPLLLLPANARQPMPYADPAPTTAAAGSAQARGPGALRVAFVSDHEGRYNLWSVDANGGDLKRHTRHADFDIRHAALDTGPDGTGTRVVYAIGADLHIVNLADNSDRVLAITLGGDMDQWRTRWVAAPPFFSAVDMAPNGEHVLINARGRLATQGTGPLRRAELPVPAGAACRAGVFSSDSRQVFALCDSSGESEIWRFAADGSGTPQRLTQDGKLTRRAIFPSPDGRWLAHTDHAGVLRLLGLGGAAGVGADAGGGTGAEPGASRVVDPSRTAAGGRRVWWAPDAKTLVFDHRDPVSRRNRLALYLVAEARTVDLTSDRYQADAPAFTPDGQWLYFLSDRRFEAVDGAPWGDRNLGPFFDRRTQIYALALQPGLRFPFQPRDELSPPAPAAAVSVTASASAAAGSSTVTATATAIAPARAAPAAAGASAPTARLPALQPAGLAQRLFEVPLPAGNYRELSTDGKRLYFLDAERGVSGRSTLRSVPIDDTATPPELLSADVQDYALTRNGKRLLIVRAPPPAAPGAGPASSPRAGEILLVDAGPKLPAEPAALARAQVRWSDWQLAVDPRSEWRQLFAEAWRLHRDHLFDAGMNGSDWAAVRRVHEALLPRVTDRLELAELMAQMVTAAGALHSQVITPDVRSAPGPVFPAGLGARFARVAEGWRVEQVFRSDPELPSAASPLQRAQVAAGEVITAINGRSTRDVPALSELLRGQEGRQVLLNVKNTAGAERKVVALPVSLARDNELRVGDWEWGLAEQARAKSEGRVGYLRLRAMGPQDISTFAREFYSHLGREGIVIDVRSNNGGNVDSWVLAVLQRRAWMFWQARMPEGAAPYPNMQQAFRGHVAVLIDGQTYSDGETFAEGVRRLGLGTLIGTRTSGAGVWLSDSNSLADNGRMRAAEFAQFALDGSWLVERSGVTPDIEVDLPPRATTAGADAQLEAAVAHLLQRIAAQPVVVPKPPPYARPFTPR